LKERESHRNEGITKDRKMWEVNLYERQRAMVAESIDIMSLEVENVEGTTK
jgi:hypothetical protein